MTTNPHLVRQLVRNHERDLMAAAEHARLRRTAAAARRRTRRPFVWRRWRLISIRPAAARTPEPSGAQARPLSDQPTTQIAT